MGAGRPETKNCPAPIALDAGQSCTQVDVSGGAGQGQELLGLGVGKHLGKLSAAHGLMGQQILRGELQLGPAPGEDLLTAGVGPVHNGLDLLVDETGHVLGVAAGLGHGPADKDLVALVAVGDGA